jgi:hypothetical protein
MQCLLKYKEDFDMFGERQARTKTRRTPAIWYLHWDGLVRLNSNSKIGTERLRYGLFGEVDNNRPMQSRLEKAKAHIKCATITGKVANEKITNTPFAFARCFE